MLTSDFKEFAELLNSNGVEYLVVGGYALAAYGHPRYTGDLDFWIASDPTNAHRVLAALAQFGFDQLGVTHDDLTTPNQVIQLGFPPGRIDLLTSIDGVSFGECYPRRMTVPVDGVTLNFISLEDFKINKKAVGRHRDLADLEALDLPPAPPLPPKGGNKQ
ncbi:MAG: hypothetical protein JWQ07_4379 [Ramlibacter sp.]|nr:hypothetical protein [Ramlibacter sp.]